MSITGTKLIDLIRGFTVDQVVSGRTNLFTDANILDAINYAKHELFGLRPDVFILNMFTTAEPADLSTSSSTLNIANWAVTPLCYKASAILLSQKSKDEFYRKAADEMLAKFNGSV